MPAGKATNMAIGLMWKMAKMVAERRMDFVGLWFESVLR